MASLNASTRNKNANLVAVLKQFGCESTNLLLHSHIRYVDPGLTAQLFYFIFGSRVTLVSLHIAISMRKSG